MIHAMVKGMDICTVAAYSWPDWFRIRVGRRRTRVAHLVPAGYDITFCDFEIDRFAAGEVPDLEPARNADRRCAHCARMAQRIGLRFPRLS